jgi:DNA end-binding protein Ku
MAERSHAHSKRRHGGTRHHASAEARNAEPTRRESAVRGIWTGSISFGLLQIPVTLVPAESRSEQLHFRMLDRRDLSPLRYERVSTATGKPVDWKNVVKGYEIEKDSFVVVEPEDFAKANVKANHTIDILDFVPRSQIGPEFFETPYFVVPQDRATKAYVLLTAVLEKMEAVAIGTFVLRTREHLVAIMPSESGMLIEVLRFGHELKDANVIALPKKSAKELDAREIAMAQQLVEGMMTDWKPDKYRDRYYQDVIKVIEEKAKTGETTEHHPLPKGTVARDGGVDLLELLKKSVAKTGRAANDARPGPKKARARKTTKRTKAA